MSNYKSKLIEEDSRSSEGIGEGELDEEGFYSYRDEDASSSSIHHQTWSPFEDLDDSGHFTASPEGERALSGSSRSHSPCSTTANSANPLLSQTQMQQHNSNSNSYQFNNGQSLYPNSSLQNQSRPLISPRSVMTVKAPQQASKNASSQNSVNSSMESCAKDEEITPEKNVSSSSLYDSMQNKLPARNLSFNSNANDTFSETSMEGGDEFSDESSTYLRGILENFNSLYLEKLTMLDNLVSTGSEEQKMLLLEKKANMLETWAKDVCVQNMVLVHTVEELEKEANRKVSALQKKITESTQAAKEHMTMIKKYEEQVKLLLKNHSDTEEKNLVLKIDLEKLRNECKRVKDRMNFLLKDNESLITLVCRIRDMGVWDVNGLELHRSSFDQIFGLYPNLVGAEVQTVFTREKAKRVLETEDKVSQLEETLATLQQTQRETESVLARKDRKIEDLETEIKNISNKTQYCEQECNDYKKSLLETQEKLLEATRRLNSVPKSPRPSVPGVSEMTELIRELRGVKSQLNTAVEEKQTAKVESNFFKRELGERLKEMHDIQNVFQTLATEVVSSRAAFQQVQEKEVQLQSLKSEVQAYQTRCANAEDTILQKEKEIVELQRQMNELHKRSTNQKLQPKPNSPSTETSDNVDEAVLKYYEDKLRNLSSPRSKIPVSRKPINKFTKHHSAEPISTNKTKTDANATPTTKSRTSMQGNQFQGRRPIWNTNFKRNTGATEKPSGELPQLSKKHSVTNLVARTPSPFKIGSLVEETEEGIDNVSQSCREVYKRLHEIGQKLSTSQEEMSMNSMNKGDSISQEIIMNDEAMNLFKLPKLEEKKSDHLTKKSLHKKQTSEKEPLVVSKSVKLDQGKLPMVIENPTGLSRRKGPTKKLENPFMKNLMDNQHSGTPRLNELISAVVETSKQLLGTEADAPMSQNKKLQTLTITASHYRKRPKARPGQEARRTKSSDKHAEANRGATPTDSDVVPGAPTKFHSTTGIHSKTSQEDDEIKAIFDPPANVQEFLENLPQTSNDDLVTTWIKKASKPKLDVNNNSSSSSNPEKNKKTSKPKPVVSGRRPSVKVMKHLATRRCPPRQNTPKTPVSRESPDPVENLNAEMFELEDEWGKVFANIECSVNDGIAGTAKTMDNKGIGLKSISSSSLHDKLTQPPSSPEAGNSTTVDSSMQTQQSGSTEDQTQTEQASESENKCQQQQESIQELLNRLAKEKQEMEEHFRKELQDKDIELKMQKISSNDFFGTHDAAVIKVDSLSNMENAWSVSDTDIKLELENAYQSSRTPTSPPQDCNCKGCINRREIADLVDRFENRKLHMLTELGSLKSYCSQLDEHASLLNARINIVKGLVNNSDLPLQEIQSGIGFPVQSQEQDREHNQRGDYYVSYPCQESEESLNQNSTEEKYKYEVKNSQYEKDMALLKKFSAKVYTQLLAQFEDLEMSFRHDKEKTEQNEHDLEVKYKQAAEANLFMVEKMKSLEKLASGLNSSSPSDESKFSSSFIVNERGDANVQYTPKDLQLVNLQELEAVRKAFDTNQQILAQHKEKLTVSNEFISKYEKFVNDMWSFVGDIIPNVENSSDLTHKLGHLCECVKQALADNGLMCKKLEALQKVLKTANRENALLNETVASLNNHIEALSRQNDKLLHQFDKRNRQKRCKSPLVVSNRSSPRSDISERAENESSVVDNARASGDSTCQMNTLLQQLQANNNDIIPRPPPSELLKQENNEDIERPYFSLPCYHDHHHPHQPCYTGESSKDQVMTLQREPGPRSLENILASADTTFENNEHYAWELPPEYLQNVKRVARYVLDLKNKQNQSFTIGENSVSSSQTTLGSPNFCMSFDNSDVVESGVGINGGGVDSFVRTPEDSTRRMAQPLPLYYFEMGS